MKGIDCKKCGKKERQGESVHLAGEGRGRKEEQEKNYERKGRNNDKEWRKRKIVKQRRDERKGVKEVWKKN